MSSAHPCASPVCQCRASGSCLGWQGTSQDACAQGEVMELTHGRTLVGALDIHLLGAVLKRELISS